MALNLGREYEAEIEEERHYIAKLWRRHPEDWYVEPEWCSKRLFEVEAFDEEVWDPSCGWGRIADAAEAAGYWCMRSDIEARCEGVVVRDFFAYTGPTPYDIVSNPPFKHADRYVKHALKISTGRVALLLPTVWSSGNRRSRWLETTPLKREWKLAPRPSMPPGPVLEEGLKPGGGTKDFSWFIWERGYEGEPQFGWLRRDDGNQRTSETE